MSKDSLQIARLRFAEIVSQADEQIDLAEAALLIAVEEYPRLDVSLYLEKLDSFANRARNRIARASDSQEVISALNETIFEDLAFYGNSESYYDPRNSFLNEVIDRRTGIPITLTVIYMEVGRRCGVPVYGVGLPFHFIAKYSSQSEEIFIDPFNGGSVLGQIECDELVSELSGRSMQLQPAQFQAVTKKQILTRMLSNLFGIYSGSNDYARALKIVERLLMITPDSASHIRDRGLLLAATGDNARAAEELKRYLTLEPAAADKESIREQIAIARQAQARLN